MKKLLFTASVVSIALLQGACDKVTQPYPKNGGTSTLDWSLYPDGDSAHYVQQGLWPTFSNNTNTNRNVLIEDFTGHRCNNCPNAATLLHSLMDANPNRVFGAGVHTSALGMSTFQEVNTEYPTILYNDQALEIGLFFGSQPGTSFIGNPHGTVNRIPTGTDNTLSPGSWSSQTTTALASTLRVNLQSSANYFASTRGVFLHTEVDKFDNTLTNELALVVYLIEDSLVAPQLMPNLTQNDTYIHRDIMRGCIDGKAFGRTLTAADQNPNGKYYVNYTYQLPDQYNPDNVHLLIYVYDKTTYEIYQVIKQELL